MQYAQQFLAYRPAWLTSSLTVRFHLCLYITLTIPIFPFLVIIRSNNNLLILAAWMYVALVGAVIFILIQVMLIVEFAHAWTDNW